ncbi:hypothetical protein P3X46_024400 [Hevea brasiliensis]|uniref:Rx N-terminal domain-containing protein n=1 Tax=Hevea brasiliensis TaxID=3981 RepID=A0ABQ9L3V9_HEVBR|nr:hypothetical protein P3X46_024400 [Hevea brasiliensis]
MELASSIGGSILSPFFDGFLAQLKFIVDKGQVSAQLQKWESILKRIHAVLDDAEEKHMTNRLVELWLNDLRDLAYDVEDVLDELVTEVQAQQRRLEEEPQVRPNKLRKIFNTIFAALNPIKEKDELHLGESTRKRIIEVRETTSLVNESKICGRDEDKKAILDLLKDKANHAEVFVIPIIGMGGVGKTTLAQLVYNDPTLEFDLKAWVSVGEDFDIVRITKTVLLQLGDGGDDKDLNLLQVNLMQKLSGKKFLVVLDDVWTEKYEQWDLLRGPFEAGAPQSRIILILSISYDECLSVFAQHALGATSFKEHLELKEMGEEIVKRCGGLPLAAKALGGILRGKRNPNLWKEVLSSEIWELPNNKSNILPALRLSYLHLPPHLKRCFAYCAILPKDPCFVSRGICLHMVDKLESANPYSKIRHSSFVPQFRNTLQRFQSFYEMKNLRTFLSVSHNVRSCYLTSKVVHDLVPKLKCLRSLSLTRYVIKELPDSIGDLKHLRYLDLSCTLVKRLPESLRDCYELMELPKGICNLLNLQHLDIIGTTKLQEMPPHIGNLTSLRVLTKFVIGKGNEQITELKKLSDLQGQLHITSLENVEVEDIRDVGVANLKDKPGITELCLEWIDKFSSDLRNSSDEEQVKLSNCCQITSLPPLGRLKSLKKLSIESLSGVKEVGVEFYEDDSCFSCLEALEISNMGQWDLWAWHNGVGGDSVAKFPKLHELRIQSCPKLVGKLPTFLPSLEKLVISNCLLLVDLPAVLPSLKNIHISNCPQLVDLPEVLPSLVTLSIRRCQEAVLRRVTNATSLISLKHLEIKGCNELVQCGSLVSFPARGLPHSLIRLRIDNCDSLASLPEGIVSHSGATSHLEEIHIFRCKSLRYPSNGKFPDSLKTLHIHNWATQLLNSLQLSHLTVLQIRNCPQLESFQGRELHMPTLVSLEIFGCERLRSLSSHMQNLQSLQNLTIWNCHQLEFFPEVGLPNPKLVFFQIDQCKNMRSLPNQMQNYCGGMESLIEGCLPLNLTELYVGECMNLKQPMPEWGLYRLASLRKLAIGSMKSTGDIISFPSQTHDGLLLPTSLNSLYIVEFKNLKSISMGIQNLTFLKEFEIFLCPNLQSFPAEGFPATLEQLYIHCCPLLRDHCLKDRGGDYWPIISHIPRLEINN